MKDQEDGEYYGAHQLDASKRLSPLLPLQSAQDTPPVVAGIRKVSTQPLDDSSPNFRTASPIPSSIPLVLAPSSLSNSQRSVHLLSSQSKHNYLQETELRNDYCLSPQFTMSSLQSKAHGGIQELLIAAAKARSSGRAPHVDCARLLRPYRSSFHITESTVSALEPSVLKSLKEELCPLCLDFNPPSSKEKAKEQDPPCIVLRCRRLGCSHVMHHECIGRDPEDVLRTLQSSHPSTSYTITPPDLTSEKPLIRQDPRIAEYSRDIARQNCRFKVKVAHLCSDRVVASYETPLEFEVSGDEPPWREEDGEHVSKREGIKTTESPHMDDRPRLDANKEEDGVGISDRERRLPWHAASRRRTDSPSTRVRSLVIDGVNHLSEAVWDEEDENKEDQKREQIKEQSTFSLSRGRIMFSCISPNTREEWHYQARFDMPKPEPHKSCHLALVDKVRDATVVIGLKAVPGLAVHDTDASPTSRRSSLSDTTAASSLLATKAEATSATVSASVGKEEELSFASQTSLPATSTVSNLPSVSPYSTGPLTPVGHSPRLTPAWSLASLELETQLFLPDHLTDSSISTPFSYASTPPIGNSSGRVILAAAVERAVNSAEVVDRFHRNLDPVSASPPMSPVLSSFDRPHISASAPLSSRVKRVPSPKASVSPVSDRSSGGFSRQGSMSAWEQALKDSGSLMRVDIKAAEVREDRQSALGRQVLSYSTGALPRELGGTGGRSSSRASAPRTSGPSFSSDLWSTGVAPDKTEGVSPRWTDTEPRRSSFGSQGSLKAVVRENFDSWFEASPANPPDRLKEGRERDTRGRGDRVERERERERDKDRERGGDRTPTWASALAGGESLAADFEVTTSNVAALARTQVGSRYLQNRLAELQAQSDPSEAKEFVALLVEGLLSTLPRLMVDLFGNYLIQKLLQAATPEQRHMMVARVAPALPTISCDRQGTRAAQKLVIAAAPSPREQDLILDALLPENAGPRERSRLLHVMLNPNGSHVIQTILQCFQRNRLNHIVMVGLRAAHVLGLDPHSLCVLKHCLELAAPSDFLHTSLALLKEAEYFVSHQYGNYLVQHMMEVLCSNSAYQEYVPGRSDISYADLFFQTLNQALVGRYAQLSCQKYSSPVIEKCLLLGNATLRSTILGEILQPRVLLELLQDSYGNYVMQHVLQVVRPAESALLREKIRPLAHSLRRNVRKKWDVLLSEPSPSVAHGRFTPAMPHMRGQDAGGAAEKADRDRAASAGNSTNSSHSSGSNAGRDRLYSNSNPGSSRQLASWSFDNTSQSSQAPSFDSQSSSSYLHDHCTQTQSPRLPPDYRDSYQGLESGEEGREDSREGNRQGLPSLSRDDGDDGPMPASNVYWHATSSSFPSLPRLSNAAQSAPASEGMFFPNPSYATQSSPQQYPPPPHSAGSFGASGRDARGFSRTSFPSQSSNSSPLSSFYSMLSRERE
eukprot:g78402.t1